MTTLAEVLRPARARRELPEPAQRRAIREQSGLSQMDVARVLGVTRVTVTKYESGARLPRSDLAVRYLRLLRRLQNEARR